MLSLNLMKPLEWPSILQERQQPEGQIKHTTKKQSAQSRMWGIQQDDWHKVSSSLSPSYGWIWKSRNSKRGPSFGREGAVPSEGENI